MSSYEFFGRLIHDDSLSTTTPLSGLPSLKRLTILAAYEAALAVASEVRIETLLQPIVEMSRSVGHARLAAYQQFGTSGQTEQFIFSIDESAPFTKDDVTDSLRQIFATIPTITSAVSVSRLSLWQDISTSNEEIAELPALIVPVLSGELQVGALVLLGHEHNEAFDGNDLDAIKLLANHAAAAIDRAHMYGLSELRNATAREQLLQLRQVLDNLPAGVMVVQPPDAWIQMANTTAASMIFGDNVEPTTVPIVYRDFLWLGPDGQELARLGHPGILALHGERIENRQLTLVNAAGTRIPVLVQAAPILTNGDDVVGAF